MPELGRLPGKKAAALAGVAPYNRDSGHLRGKRMIRGGRRYLRRVRAGDSPQGWQLYPSWQDLHCFKGCSSSGVAGRTSTTFTE
jgi:hypothetical protein